MPTECERSDVTLYGQEQQQQQQQQQALQQSEIQIHHQQQQQPQQQQEAQEINHQRLKEQEVEEAAQEETEDADNNQQKQYHETILVESEYYTMEERKELPTTFCEMSTSQTSTTSTTSSNGHNGSSNGGGRKSSIISPDPTAYVTKARVTKPTPPPPSYNPMQFVQIKPSHLYQTAQQQLKKAEEVKKIKEVKKEEPEDWQNNLDNWKSSRRKRVEHIIDRVVEVKKLELEEHDRSRRKSKTFSEMIEERGERGPRGRTKLVSLAVYNEDESNDLSDLGIGTSSASGKSSISEDYDNNSVMSDNAAELDKAIFAKSNSQQIENHKNNYQEKVNTENNNGTSREYVSSPGYDTSSSTAPASSPDPCEYTYEGAIQDYKQRVSRAVSGNANAYKLPTNGNTSNNNHNNNNTKSASKESTPESTNDSQALVYPTRRGSKIEDRLIGFEVTSPSDSQESVEKQKVDVPKIDISKRKEIFEQTTEPKLTTACTNGVTAPKVTLRDRFNVKTVNTVENTNIKRDIKRMSGDMTSIRDRLQSLEQQQNQNTAKNGISAVSRIGDIPVPPLKERLSCLQNAVTKEEIKKKPISLVDDRQLEIMKDEDENAKLRLRQQYAEQASNDMIADIESELGKTMKKLEAAPSRIESEPVAEGEQQLNAAIAALAIEEQQLEAAANAVNQIEAEFAELSDGALLAPPNNTATTNDMEFSVSVTNQNIPKEVICENNSSNNSSSIGNNVNVITGDLVKNIETQSNNLGVLGKADVSTSSSPTSVKLQRKPSNEMVHHRNLLKMFKDTFKNDIDLDETEEEEQQLQTNQPQEVDVLTSKRTEDANNNLEVEENITTTTVSSLVKATSSAQSLDSSCKASTSSVNTIIPQSPTTANRNTSSMIPRSLNSPVGKPPMSPMSTRNYNKMTNPESPLCSPIAMRRPESQFSINGRVEIFNSKNINNNSNNNNYKNNDNNNNNLAKPPTTPTLPRKSYLPHLISTAHSGSSISSIGSGIGTSAVESKSHIELPTSSVAATTLTTVTQPALSSFPMVSNNNNIIINNKPNSFDADVNIISGRSMPTIETTVNEPEVIRYSTSKPVLRTTTTNTPPFVQQEALKDRQQQRQQEERLVTDNEVIMCAPPVTILNPDELPKPNTVRAMASCFSHNNAESSTGKRTPPTVPPKPIPRNQATKLPRQIQKTPPQSPLAVRRDLATDIIAPVKSTESAEKPPIVNARNSGISTGYSFITKPKAGATPKVNPLKPNDSLTPLVLEAATEPLMVACSPNSSSLYKLAGSTPPSPVSPRSTNMSSIEPSATDITFCADFLDALGASADIKTFESPPKLEHQTTVEEVACEKVDVKKLAPGETLPATGYADISTEDIDRCDGVQVAVNKSPPKVDAKSQSPIGIARAAHSKALIETCERIIAEERLASSRMKSAMTPIKKPVEPASPKNTPTMQRKSKIPLPRNLPCLKGSGSMNNADLATTTISTEIADNLAQEEGPLIARLHVVETQIKVTSTPPSSPKVMPKSHLPSPVAQPKKSRNIFEFLKKNFGHNHEEAAGSVKTQENHQSNKDKDKVIVKEDEIHTVHNSTFYLPINDNNNEDVANNNNKDGGGEEVPPPLPLTPAPVNIEITKTITTDEILESANTELALSREIHNLLDDELEKLKSEKTSASVKNII